MPASWWYEPQVITCPCCGRECVVPFWEALLYYSVRDTMTIPVEGHLKASSPRRVLLLDQRGHRLAHGWAQTFRCHGGLYDVWVTAKRGGWEKGRWHPLGRVLWELAKE